MSDQDLTVNGDVERLTSGAPASATAPAPAIAPATGPTDPSDQLGSWQAGNHAEVHGRNVAAADDGHPARVCCGGGAGWVGRRSRSRSTGS